MRSTDTLLKNANVLQVGTAKTFSSPLFREATKTENFLDESKTNKKCKKNRNGLMLMEVM